MCKLVLRYKATRNSSIQQMLLTILPRLAAFQPKRFVKKWVNIIHKSLNCINLDIGKPCVCYTIIICYYVHVSYELWYYTWLVHVDLRVIPYFFSISLVHKLASCAQISPLPRGCNALVIERKRRTTVLAENNKVLNSK